MATEKKTASEDALKAAEVELASLEEKHVDLLATCNAAAETAETSAAVVATNEGRLAQVKSAFSTFTELLERQSSVPEPAAKESSMMEDKLEAIGETSPKEIAVVA